jgi:hypothetical protein
MKKSDYTIYHNSYSAAVQEAENFATKNHYELNQDQIFQDIGVNTKRPRDGETTKFKFDLYADNKLQRKKLHAQVYGRGTQHNSFELNMYIS